MSSVIGVIATEGSTTNCQNNAISRNVETCAQLKIEYAYGESMVIAMKNTFNLLLHYIFKTIEYL